METITAAPVKLTNGAVAQIKKLMLANDFDHSKTLRIGVKGGGCSGMSYILGFDEKQATDEIFESDGLTYIMNPGHGIYLFGMEVDWQDGLNARGFTFTNPNASKTCGCGTSFAV
jgi:iron-sulfur cluster assembly accessory protein